MKRFLLIVLPLFLIIGCGKNGLHTEYYDNGQKKFEKNYKDGKKDGISTKWYENGQKGYNKATYKDGEVISEECWDINGNEIDCSD